MTAQQIKAIEYSIRVALRELGPERLASEEFFGTNQQREHEMKLAA